MQQLVQDKKKLTILLIAVWVLCLVDLAAPSALAGLKRGLPKNIRGSLPWMEGLVVGGGSLYAAGAIAVEQFAKARRQDKLRRVGLRGRTFEVIVPRDSKAGVGEMADLLARVHGETVGSWGQWRAGDCTPISWEWVAAAGKIRCQVWVPDDGRDAARTIQTEVATKYPESRVIPVPDLLAALAGDDEKNPLAAAACVEMRLSGPAHHPIKGADEFTVDPLASVLHALGSVESEPGIGLAAVQVVTTAAPAQEWEPARAAAVGAIRARAGSGWVGAISGRQAPAAKSKALTAEEKKRLAQLEGMGGQPAFRVLVRIIVAGDDPQTCQRRARNIASKFGQYSSTEGGSPQAFEIAREYVFRPGRQQPAGAPTDAAGAPAGSPVASAAAGLSESQAATLRQMLGSATPGRARRTWERKQAAPDSPPAPPPPVAEAQPILLRMDAADIPRKFWPPWKASRPSILLASDLATVFHFPHRDLSVPGLVTRLSRYIPPPREVLISPFAPKPPGWLILGMADDEKEPHWLVGAPIADLRAGGVYVLGPAGSGKSVLLRFIGRQFVDEHRGLSVIDPKEDLARALALDVPLEEEGNVVWVHPATAGRPVVVNILDRRLIKKIGPDQVAAGALAVFQKLMGVNWEQAINVRRILAQAIMALAMGEPEPSLLQLYAFLQDDTEDRPNEYRARVLEQVTDSMVTTFWLQQFPAIAKQYGQSLVSVMTRVESFLRNRMTRYLTGLRESTVNFRQIMDGDPGMPGGLIFLASVPDTLGDVQSFVGALFFNQLVAAGFSRYQDIPDERQRRDHAIIIDEFQTFAAEGSTDMENLLAKLRGARVAVILAHQGTSQINPRTMEAILTNNRTRIFFALQSEQDARTAAGPWRASLRPEDLMGMQARRYEIYVSTQVNGAPTGPFSARSIWTPDRPQPPLVGTPAAEFIWPENDAYDVVVNNLALLEAEMSNAARSGDWEREEFYLQAAVRELRKMSPSQYARYLQRRKERDQAEREWILRNPGTIPDKLSRIARLSDLRFGKPRAEAEIEVVQALAEVMGKPEEAVVGHAGGGGVEFSVAQIFG